MGTQCGTSAVGRQRQIEIVGSRSATDNLEMDRRDPLQKQDFATAAGRRCLSATRNAAYDKGLLILQGKASAGSRVRRRAEVAALDELVRYALRRRHLDRYVVCR